ncbi:MAG: tetratricopeptide repeat protein [Desulfobacteraceae bacterium]|nr:tetratricopeptide repeat protein [Desulfobacteraceae bacterium]
MENHFNADKIPEFLYPFKEGEKNHRIVYTDNVIADILKKRFSDFFYADDISDFANFASDESLGLVLFALAPFEKDLNTLELFDTLCGLIQEAGKKTQNPCVFIKNKAPGILFNTNSVDYLKKTASDIRKKFTQKTEKEAIAAISYHPCINYRHKNLSENGLKALIHASMLEDKIAVFDSVSLNVSSDDFFQKKDIENAIAELEKGLLLDSRDYNILNSLGVCFAAKKDFDRSLSYFEKAYETSDKKFIMPLYNQGLIHYLQNKISTAEKIFLKALEFSDNFYEIPFYLGKIKFDQKNHKQALEYFLMAESIKPESATVLNYLGEIYLMGNDLENAFLVYKKSLKFLPDNPYALSAIGFIYYMKGENREISRTFIKESLEMEPDNPLFKKRFELVSKENYNDETESSQKLFKN